MTSQYSKLDINSALHMSKGSSDMSEAISGMNIKIDKNEQNEFLIKLEGEIYFGFHPETDLIHLFFVVVGNIIQIPLNQYNINKSSKNTHSALMKMLEILDNIDEDFYFNIDGISASKAAQTEDKGQYHLQGEEFMQNYSEAHTIDRDNTRPENHKIIEFLFQVAKIQRNEKRISTQSSSSSDRKGTGLTKRQKYNLSKILDN